ncbi:MAG: putative glucarate transporter [candidate division WS2 bacterium]|uniref:Glucarate transporter n=1 Tax=Psychracetigena formicireducens TaxID=2986056 RepID=A0A9E2BHD4_PSYF1|nr:putative glucarate transporter [Candidatus Psychracetigena formicireducens]MBT9145084.1 putative glucarate transporter [Candidatus Psychracetigena formicireducens]
MNGLLGVGMLAVGAVFSIFELLDATFAMPAGWVADRYNRARVYVFSGAISLLGLLFLLFSPNSLVLLLVLLFLFILIYSLGINIGYTSRYSLTLDLVPEEKRGAVFGLFHTLTFLFPIGAGLMLGILLDLGFRAIFMLCVLLKLIDLLLRLRIHDPQREAVTQVPLVQVEHSTTGSQPEATPRGLISRVKSLFRSFRSDMGESWSVFIHKRDLLALVMIGTLGSLSYGVSAVYFIIYFHEILHFAPLQIGLLFSLHAAGIALAGILGGMLSDRLGCRTVLTTSSLVSGVLTFVFVYVQRFDVMIAVFFLLALEGGLYAPNYQVLLGELTPEGHQGRVFSFMDVCTTGATAVGPLLGGWLWIALGPTWVFITDGILTILCAILLLCFIKR